MDNREKLEALLADIRSDRVKKVILDTDTYNEIDDQYALAYCYLSHRINLCSVNAAPFYNDRSSGFEDGMLKSYDEIHRILRLTDPDYKTPVYYGSRTTIEVSGAAVDSPAARNIIDTVKNSDETVYVLAIGAITNVASALMMDPSIKDNMCVVWLGGNDIKGDNLGEFNLVQDYTAGQILLNSGVPLLLCPAWFIVSVLTTNIELTRDLKGHNPLCDYLAEITEREWVRAGSRPDWVRTVWDIAAPAILECPDCADIDIIPTPVFTDQRVYAFDSTRHKMLYLKAIDREKVYSATWKILKGC
ncbi:MAG: nucleoside hydrolase [Candidatus Avispirillum sp.]